MAVSLRTNAIVLGRTNYGEADRIIKVLTPRDGKISVMAKSVRREKSKLAGGIELFAVCDVNLHLGKGDLATLTGARLKQVYSKIILDYDKLQFAYEVLKQISKATEAVEEPEFYELTDVALASLNEPEIDLKITETWFYLHLAKLLGGELNIKTDVNGMGLVEEAKYDFAVHDQSLVFAENGEINAGHIKILRLMVHNPPSVIAKIADLGQYIDECLRLARAVAKI
jgi:DNA repair protein RecO (recombination protein O)